MTTKKAIYFLVILSLLVLASSAYADQDDDRYFIKSNSGFWRKSFGVRHNFNNGFTTDLSDWQLKVAKIFGVEVQPVKKFNILPDMAKSPNGQSKNTPSRPIPASQVPWGVKALYNDQLLAKTSGGAGVKVAVLDTGVLKNHLDLKNRIKDCKDFSSASNPIIDGKCDDKNGHGTHVSGIIAADGGNDGLGIFGLAPEVDLLAYKVCSNSGSCWADDIAIAVKTATDNGANVINLSLGSDTASSLINDAIDYAVDLSVLIVAAAGNDGPPQASIDYPGAYVKVVAVGAMDGNNQIPDWSSRGINSITKPYVVEEKDIEFAAPGISVESTWKDGGYAVLSGTSMATPHVAGLAAKLWQKDSLTPAASTRDLLHQFSTDLLPFGDDDASGWGLPHL